MGRRVILFLVLAFLCVGVVVYILYPTDENRIRKIISSSEEAVISENIDGFMNAVSFNYSDDYGNNYLLLKKRMQSAFKRFDNIKIERSIDRISVEDDNAEAELSFRVSVSLRVEPCLPAGRSSTGGEEREYIIGDADKPQTIIVYFFKSSYEWLIIKVDGILDSGSKNY